VWGACEAPNLRAPATGSRDGGAGSPAAPRRARPACRARGHAGLRPPTLPPSSFQGQPARRARNPYLGLKHNFMPVAEETHAPAKVIQGVLPPALAGVFARIGPNPALPPSGDYHWFDG